MNHPIALLTDFGNKDPFVGMMKGVILGINPSAEIVDLGHDIEPGDITKASFALAMAFPYFPKGTVFCAVIDPGVGTDRRAVAAEIEGRFFVGPDNGLLSWTLLGRKPARAVELTKEEYRLADLSSTFHGRDLFAPVAAHISKGVSLGQLGPSVGDLNTFPIPGIEKADNSLRGEVVYIDRFGNLLANISRTDYEEWRGGRDVPLVIHIGSIEIKGISRTYSDGQSGHPVALFGSSGMLEIAVNGGSAEYTINASPGSHVLLLKMEK